MTVRLVQLSILAARLSICRLAADNQLPAWLPARGFLSVTRTADELSVVCEENCVPAGVQSQRGWSCFKVRGPIAFSQGGVLASLAAPLAESGISIFAISTFDTDYLLVEEKNLDRAAAVLTAAGHKIHKE
jgi:hypothetical protein